MLQPHRLAHVLEQKGDGGIPHHGHQHGVYGLRHRVEGWLSAQRRKGRSVGLLALVGLLEARLRRV